MHNPYYIHTNYRMLHTILTTYSLGGFSCPQRDTLVPLADTCSAQASVEQTVQPVSSSVHNADCHTPSSRESALIALPNSHPLPQSDPSRPRRMNRPTTSPYDNSSNKKRRP
jgi:hypothetical protein